MAGKKKKKKKASGTGTGTGTQKKSKKKTKTKKVGAAGARKKTPSAGARKKTSVGARKKTSVGARKKTAASGRSGTRKMEREVLPLPLPAEGGPGEGPGAHEGSDAPERALAERLIAAIEAGDLLAVQGLIADGAQAGRVDHEEGCTPLELAAGLGLTAIVCALLEAGAPVDLGLVQAPLGAAASQGHLEVIEVLLHAGASVDAPGEDALTPLMSAAAAGRREAVERLLAAGADPDRRSAHGDTAIALAALSGEEELLRLLAERTAPEEVARAERLLAAIRRRLSRRTRRPQLPAPAPEVPWISEELAARGALEVQLTPGGFTVTFPWGDEDGDLLAAAEAGYEGILGGLLRDGADPEEAELLSGHTPLMRACAAGQLACVRLLLAAGADPAARDQGGATSLHHLVALPAASAGRRDRAAIAGLLLEWGADPAAQDAQGEAPLHLAVRWGYVEVARALLEAGASPVQPNQTGQTARALAAGHAELEPLLG